MAVLRKFAWRPIAEGLDKREKRIADDIAAAERSNQEARQLLAQYQERLAGAEGEIREMIERGRREAEKVGHEMIEKARAETQAEKERAVHEIDDGHDRGAEGTGRPQRGLGGRFGRQDRPVPASIRGPMRD